MNSKFDENKKVTSFRKMSPSTELPKDWSWVKLGDIAEFNNGINFNKSDKGEKGILTIDVLNMYSQSIYTSMKNLYRVRKTVKDKYKLKYGDLLFVRSSVKREGVGWISIFKSYSEDVTYCGFIIRARLINRSTLPEYLAYFFRTSIQREKIISSSKQVTITNISQDNLKEFVIPLPPLPVQHKIVAKIEELFSELDKGIENFRKAKEQIKTYKQSVLAYAFNGKLTGKVKGETEDGKLPEGWKWVKLGEVCEDVGMVSMKEKNIKVEFVYYDIGGINNQSNAIESYKKLSWSEAPSRARQIVKKGDVLFSTVRTYLKNIALIKYDFEIQIASTGFCVIRPNDYLLSEYIFYYSLSKNFLEPLNDLQTGSSYPAVRDNDVFNQLIPLATLNQQRRIVSEIERRFSVADKLEQTINESLEKAEHLKQSILKQAFEGRLVE